MNFFRTIRLGALIVAWLAAAATVAALFFDTGSPAEPKWLGVLVVFCVGLVGTWLSLMGDNHDPTD